MRSWQKYGKFLYIPALFLASAGLTVGLISGQWSSLSLGLLIAGAILFLGWLLLLVITSKDFWQKKKYPHWHSNPHYYYYCPRCYRFN